MRARLTSLGPRAARTGSDASLLARTMPASAALCAAGLFRIHFISSVRLSRESSRTMAREWHCFGYLARIVRRIGCQRRCLRRAPHTSHHTARIAVSLSDADSSNEPLGVRLSFVMIIDSAGENIGFIYKECFTYERGKTFFFFT